MNFTSFLSFTNEWIYLLSSIDALYNSASLARFNSSGDSFNSKIVFSIFLVSWILLMSLYKTTIFKDVFFNAKLNGHLDSLLIC